MIYLVPEFKTASGEIMNVMNQEEEPVGYLAYLYEQKEKLYVFGTLKKKGEEQNFVDVVENYMGGLQHSLGVDDNTQVFLDVAGEPVALNEQKERNDEQASSS